MTVICHQPYDQFKTIPIQMVIRATRAFGPWLKRMFNGGSINLNMGNGWTPNLNPPEEMLNGEPHKYW